MDFLEIRRKAKERAAARAAAGAAPSPGADQPQVDAAPAAPRPPLALDPLPVPAADLPSTSPMPDPDEVAAAAGPAPSWPDPPPPPEAPSPPAATAPDPDAEQRAADAAAEAARLEAELEARLRDMPAAPDGRFRTWRPSGGVVSDLQPITPEPHARGRRHGEAAERRRSGREERAAAPPGDPLDDFFYREDEPGPELGELAAPSEAPAPAEVVERVEYLTFLLGSESYGVEIDRVREVMRSPPITEVPRAPPDVLGVITVRGEVVAVFDPRRRLGLPRGEVTEGGRVIIVDDGAGPCGLLVDGVASVVRLPRGSIEARPQGIGGAHTDCLEGIGRDRDRLFTVLSVAALLKPTRRAEARG